MKIKNISYIVFFLVTLVQYSLHVAAADNNHSVTTNFDQSELVHKTVDAYGLVEIKGADLDVQASPGTPLLPVSYIRVAVPATAAFESLTITSVDTESLSGSYYLYPTQVPTRFDQTPSFTLPDTATYNLTTKFPSTIVEYVESGVVAGYKFFVFRINPLQYIPTNRQLWLNKAITFSFSYEQTLAPQEVPPENDVMKELFKSTVVNPEDVSGSQAPLPLGTGLVDYLIITSNVLTPSYGALKTWKTQKGISTEILTTEYIDANYPGIDAQERIRNAIKDYWLNKGTLYVLLGGDDTVLPDRDCQISASIYIEDHMPTDLYYSGLDGSWDEDGDGIFCERTSTSGSPEVVDMDPDVFVGRAAVQTLAHAAAFVNKVIQYEKNGDKNFQRKMLLAGPEVFSTSPTPPAGYTHSPVSDAEIELDKLFNNFVAPYYTPELHRFYDTFTSFDTLIAGDFDLTPGSLEDKISEGYNFITVYTHGGPGSWSMESGGAFTTTNVANLFNSQRQGLIYTIACTTNRFDDFDPSLSEAFIRNPSGGAAAYIGSSRYGWWKTSNYYAEEFYRQLFEEKRNVIGQAFAFHKQAKTSSASFNGTSRWLQFSLNLLGDPTMEIWTPLPDFMLTANTNQSVDLRISNGDGTFQSPIEIGDATIGTDYSEFAIAEFNGDKQLDFIGSTNEDPARLYLFSRIGSNDFQQAYLTTLEPDPKTAYFLNGGNDPLRAPDYGLGLITADLDNDGDMDFLENINHHFDEAKYWIAKGNAHLNDGSGNFSKIANAFEFTSIYTGWTLGMSSTLADVDGDGYPDILASEQSSGNAVSSEVYLLTGNGDGTFQPPVHIFTTASHPATYMSLGDFNNDGKADALIGQDDDGDPGAAFLFKGYGDGTFDQIGFEVFDSRDDLEFGTDHPGHGKFQAYDADFDGVLDIISASGFYGPVAGAPLDAELLFFRGNGDGTFEGRQIVDPNILTPLAFTAPLTSPLAIRVWGDLNGDRVIDSNDYQLFRSTLGKCEGEASYATDADYDGDGCITYADYRVWYGYYRAQ